MKSGILHENRFGELVVGWDHAMKINAFEERYLSYLNITVMGWNIGVSNEILGLAFLFFLWDNALQKLRMIPSHFAKCKPQIRTLYVLVQQLWSCNKQNCLQRKSSIVFGKFNMEPDL